MTTNLRRRRRRDPWRRLLSLVSGVRVAGAVSLGAITIPLAGLGAQIDFYNLDRGRPLRMEDASVIERHALELQLAPVRLSGARGSATIVALEPQVEWGFLPRTQLDLGVPIESRRPSGERRTGAAGIDLSLLHALNAESVTWPALALRAGVRLPAGAFGVEHAMASLGALATRTMSFGRVHLGAEYAVGPGGGNPTGGGVDGVARWTVGAAADHAFVLHSLLIGGDVVLQRPLGASSTDWSAAGGVRYQVEPRLAIDAGVGRGLQRGGGWFVTLGSALSLAVVGRMPRTGGAR